MLKCDSATFQSAGREITLLPDVDSVAAALQIGISAASCSSGRRMEFVMESVSLELALWSKVFHSPTA